MARGLIGKFLRGAAEAAIPIAKDFRTEKALKDREDRLKQYQDTLLTARIKREDRLLEEKRELESIALADKISRDEGSAIIEHRRNKELERIKKKDRLPPKPQTIEAQIDVDGFGNVMTERLQYDPEFKVWRPIKKAKARIDPESVLKIGNDDVLSYDNDPLSDPNFGVIDSGLETFVSRTDGQRYRWDADINEAVKVDTRTPQVQKPKNERATVSDIDSARSLHEERATPRADRSNLLEGFKEETDFVSEQQRLNFARQHRKLRADVEKKKREKAERIADESDKNARWVLDLFKNKRLPDTQKFANQFIFPFGTTKAESALNSSLLTGKDRQRLFDWIERDQAE